MAHIDYAVKYITSGFPVIPLCWPDYDGDCACGRGHLGKSIGKVPLTDHGLKDATTTQQGVREYWGRWKQANIGIVIKEGYFVLDVDIEKGGFDSLQSLQEKIGELPKTLQITTGSGGAHFWYKTNKPIRNTARLAGYDGLDIRGQGGYVVAPSSIHRNGLPYETSPVWDGDIVMAPPELIELCWKPTVIVSQGQNDGTTYSEGQRNDALTRDAGAMRRRGLSEEAIFAALQVTNQQRCQPPLSETEVEQIAHSIGRYFPEPPLIKKKRMGVNLA